MHRNNLEPWVYAIGSSTGSVPAIRTILQSLTANDTKEHLPPILIVIHMPPKFTAELADILQKEFTKLDIKEATHEEELRCGMVRIAPAGVGHLGVRRFGMRLLSTIKDEGKSEGFQPSATQLFRSLAQVNPTFTVAAILTGLGRDGADGLLDLHRLGGYTIGQDEASCVVYGMPKVAFEMGACTVQVPLNKIAQHFLIGRQVLMQKQEQKRKERQEKVALFKQKQVK